MPSFSITQPGPTARQVSDANPEGRAILSVLTKRTYRIDSEGKCTTADEQQPLLTDGIFDPDQPSWLLHDFELYPFKPLTDLVIKGHATCYPARPRFDVVVEVGSHRKIVAVIGDRMCALAGAGEIVFTPPAPVERIPLGYDRAYGGTDTAALEKYGDPIEELRPFLPEGSSPGPEIFYTYPRNHSGRGYLFEPTVEAVNRLVLPNFEDPQDLLTPQRIIAKQPGKWLHMPIPHGLDWVAPASFPRSAYSGISPMHDPYPEPYPEAARGWAAEGLLAEKPMIEKFSYRLANGASLGLQLPYLQGVEAVRLTHLHPKHRQFVVRLPGDRPAIWTDGRKGKLNETEPVLHTVVIDLDQSLLTTVWRGAAPALRPYMAEELSVMPLRVEWPQKK